MITPDTVYFNKDLHKDNDWIVCKKISKKWVIIEEHDNPSDACRRRDELANNDLIDGKISDPLFYQVFHKKFTKIEKG